jgi:hypothetical protein
MDSLFYGMSSDEKDLFSSTFVLDNNCLDKGDSQAPEYVLSDLSDKLKTVTARKCFVVLHKAVERAYGQLRNLPRCVQIHFTLV